MALGRVGAGKRGHHFSGRPCLLRQLPSQKVGWGRQCPARCRCCGEGTTEEALRGPPGLGLSLTLGWAWEAVHSPALPSQLSPGLRAPHTNPCGCSWLPRSHPQPASKYLELRDGGTRNKRELIPKPQGSGHGGRRGSSLFWVLPLQLGGVTWRPGDRADDLEPGALPWEARVPVC